LIRNNYESDSEITFQGVQFQIDSLPNRVSSDRIVAIGVIVAPNHVRGAGHVEITTTSGLDIAKNLFQVHRRDAAECAILKILVAPPAVD
jgi:hypothetical protein